MLTEDELASYMSRRQRSGEFVREVLHDVGGGGDFLNNSARVYVQMYRSKNGGCEMFVTRIEKRGVKFRMKAEEQDMKYRPRQSEHSTGCICRFNSLSELISACARLNAFNTVFKTEESSAYTDGNGVYFLVCAPNIPEFPTICGEYGGEHCDYSVFLQISERCRCLCEKNAIPTLSQLC